MALAKSPDSDNNGDDFSLRDFVKLAVVGFVSRVAPGGDLLILRLVNYFDLV
jgi:hypothetical protein